MDFTKNQKEAIEYFDSPLLIVAGPGAGKTGVLINKVDYLINKKNISPSNIIITTFTIKAAEELRKRITRLNPNKDVSPMLLEQFIHFVKI
jgi:DNA helicase-2/ATP-dependent DNA helicase PcrA